MIPDLNRDNSKEYKAVLKLTIRVQTYDNKRVRAILLLRWDELRAEKQLMLRKQTFFPLTTSLSRYFIGI